MAVDYLRRVARQYPRRRLRLGGHSKGGNLAVYAAVSYPASLQRRPVRQCGLSLFFIMLSFTSLLSVIVYLLWKKQLDKA